MKIGKVVVKLVETILSQKPLTLSFAVTLTNIDQFSIFLLVHSVENLQ